MKTALAILRGINVSGQKRVPMNELKHLVEELNCQQVKTYVQSGNVVFTHSAADEEQLRKQIEKKIVETFGFQVPVLIRSLNELTGIVAHNPFLQEDHTDLDKLHVTFLADVPDTLNRDKLKELAVGTDRFFLSGKELYVYCPGGYGNTKLSNTFFENKLKVTATTRNWKTVNELLKMMHSLSPNTER
ncbi:DUF1697 domain-containing protein [Larkinella humicola]|uniref:DUF1697 domain-containing protein n=1 Tax=Larkinella humicola TaxID=2607654 RepID=A0A5N1JGZ2_9BACT|nr:DUF1697 domain-containing protein [Larkinella humicola]KAA9354645.1 DUF1697 domain-containing protein [Larkinella humicola]